MADGAELDKLRRELAALRLLPGHVKALKASDAGEAAAAAKEIGELARDDANWDAIEDAGAIPPLVALLTNGAAAGREEAARALCRFSDCGANEDVIVAAEEILGVCCWR